MGTPYLPSEILELLAQGAIPRRAVLAFALIERPDWPDLRARLVSRCRWRLDRGDFGAYLAIAAGVVTAAEADPRGCARAADAVAKVAAAPKERQLACLCRFSSLLGHPALFDGLVAKARERSHHSADEADRWLGFAARSLARLRAVGHLPAPVLAEREVRWAAHVADGVRARGDLLAASAAFAALTADPARRRVLGLGVHAELWSLESSLLRSLRRFDEAAALLDRCQRIYRVAGDRKGLVGALTERGDVAESAGDLSAAITWRAAAVEAVEGIEDPRLVRTAHRKLATSLVSAGRLCEAESLLRSAESALPLGADPSDRTRRTWLQGKIARAREQYARAVRELRATVAELEELGLTFEAAVARLDLAELYLALGRPRPVYELAVATVAAFKAREVGREAIRALVLWQRAAAAECLHPAFLAEVQRYLMLVKADPAYAYEPASPGSRRVIERLAAHKAES